VFNFTQSKLCVDSTVVYDNDDDKCEQIYNAHDDKQCHITATIHIPVLNRPASNFCHSVLRTFLSHITSTQCIRCGLLLQMSHTAWLVSGVCVLVTQKLCYAKMAEVSEMLFWG